MTFGQKLQQLRKTRGLSQEDLAQQLSVTRQTISKWELDQSTPDLPYLAAISEYFDVSTDYLIKESLASPDATAQMDIDTLLAKLQRKRPTARQVFFVLFLISLAGIVLPMVLLTIAEMFSLGWSGFSDGCLLIFLFSTAMSVFCGIFASILTWREKHPRE